MERWAYDEHFRGAAAYDLRRESPQRGIRYCCNEDRDPSLDRIAPERVPHAIEVRFSPQATRERDWREVPGAREFAALPNVRRVIYAYTLNDPVQDAQLREMESTLNDFMHMRRQAEREPAADGGATPLLRWFAARRLPQQVARRTIAWYHELHRGPAWQRTERALVSMQSFLAERGIEFVLVVFPLFHDFDDYPFLALHRRLLSTAERHGIRAIDLWPAFEGSDETSWWVHPRDFHPNHRAHAVVAEVLRRERAW